MWIKTDGRVRLEGKMSEGRAVRKKNINFLKRKKKTRNCLITNGLLAFTT